MTTAFSIPKKTVVSSRDNLLSYAEQLNSQSGPFLRDVESMQRLKKKVAELEAVCDAPILSNVDKMVGDWKLLCTTDSVERREQQQQQQRSRRRTFPLPLLPGFLTKKSLDEDTSNPFEKNVRESVRVIQRIRRDDNNDNPINRVDNVIEFIPLTWTDVLPFSISDTLNNLNPLEVTKSKVSLIHTAEVQSVSPVLRTKIVLKSIVVNVAGKSQFLEPQGDDVLGLNVPFGDLANFGSFDTTYVDDTLRISRGKTGFVEQLRVFIREDTTTKVSEEFSFMINDDEDSVEEEAAPQELTTPKDEMSSAVVVEDKDEVVVGPNTTAVEENENVSSDDDSSMENDIVDNKEKEENGGTDTTLEENEYVTSDDVSMENDVVDNKEEENGDNNQ